MERLFPNFNRSSSPGVPGSSSSINSNSQTQPSISIRPPSRDPKTSSSSAGSGISGGSRTSNRPESTSGGGGAIKSLILPKKRNSIQIGTPPSIPSPSSLPSSSLSPSSSITSNSTGLPSSNPLGLATTGSGKARDSLKDSFGTKKLLLATLGTSLSAVGSPGSAAVVGGGGGGSSGTTIHQPLTEEPSSIASVPTASSNTSSSSTRTTTANPSRCPPPTPSKGTTETERSISNPSTQSPLLSPSSSSTSMYQTPSATPRITGNGTNGEGFESGNGMERVERSGSVTPKGGLMVSEPNGARGVDGNAESGVLNGSGGNGISEDGKKNNKKESLSGLGVGGGIGSQGSKHKESSNHTLEPSSTSSASSHLQPPPTAESGSRKPSGLSLAESFANEDDNNRVRLLYAKIDEEGVEGDGWEDGTEQSREGRLPLLNFSRWPRRNSTGTVLEDPGKWKKELEVLSRVDRYGFLLPGSPDSGYGSSDPSSSSSGLSSNSRSQHHRVAKLQKPAYAHPPRAKSPTSTVASSPVASSPPSPTTEDMPSLSIEVREEDPHQRGKEYERIDKWSKMLKRAETKNEKDFAQIQRWRVADDWLKNGGNGVSKRFQKRVYKGIPDRWRQAAWVALIEHRSQGKGSDFETYAKQYHELVDQPCTHDVQIDLDVPRTISGNVLFHTRYGKGQRALFHVLHAFALHCSVCGYCQGMGPIAATLLCYLEPERVYCCMLRLHDSYGLHDIFEPGFPGLVECFYVQERLVELLAPGVHKAFETHMISTSSYATKWYITLFTNSVSFQMQLRLWDAFLLDGQDVLVLTAVAIVWGLKDQFTSESASFESILSLLSSFFDIEDEDGFLRWIRKTLRRKDIRPKMNEWRREWKGFVESGEARNKMT